MILPSVMEDKTEDNRKQNFSTEGNEENEGVANVEADEVTGTN